MTAACEKIDGAGAVGVDCVTSAKGDGAILRAGPLSAVLESGELRYVRFAGIEVVRRVFVAVRDTAWGSVPPRVVRSGSSAVSREGFCADLEVEHCSPDADFAWAGE